MTKINNEQLIHSLNWRCAIKKFDPTKKISTEDWKTLELALILTPSSFGLQPWKFIVITDQATKNKLVPVSWNQPQIADASHMVVFAIRKNVGEAYINRYVDRIAEVRKVSKESLETYQQMMIGSIVEGPIKPIVNEWATRQLYIAVGNFLTSAAVLGIDACPMEGIQPPEYDKILGLEAKGFASVVVCTAGYRAADDKYAQLAKVRFKETDVIEHI